MSTTLFYRLLLAFLLADYPLQTDWVFKIRYEKRWGVALHAGIHLLVTLAVCLPYLHSPWFIVGVVVLQAVHGLFDTVKKNGLLGFFADQLFHFASLAALAWIFGHLEPAWLTTGWLADLWRDDYLINLLSGMILAGYTTMIAVNFGNKSLRKDFERELFSGYYRYSMVLGGVVSYSGLVLVYQLSPLYLLLAAAPPITLGLLARKNGDDDGSFHGAYPLDYLFSFLSAALWATLVGLKLYP